MNEVKGFLAPRSSRACLLPLLNLRGLWACYVRLFRECVIKLQRRADRKSFFKRNQDQLMLLGAVLGGIVTFAGVMAKEHFYPSGTAGHAPNPA
jgi:hypothetical protein